MNKLPQFNLDSYQSLLEELTQSYGFGLIKDIGKDASNIIYLRHDVDFHLTGIDKLSSLEEKAGIRATYFILLSAQYNVFEKKNRQVLDAILAQGHEIGLHYDLMDYPVHDYRASEEKLHFETDVLEKLLGTKIYSIVMHQPHTGVHDIFKDHPHYIHPHNPVYQENMTYISDSCRAWRDESLLDVMQARNGGKVQINLHPEVWLGHEKDRMEFLNGTLDRNLKYPVEQLKADIKNVWSTHIAALNHDKREGI